MNIKDQMMKVGTRVHRAVFDASKGKLLGSAGGMPVLVLTTTGAKTGQARKTMLTAPIADDTKVVLVGSYGGDPREPAWFRNLRKNPDIGVTMKGSDRKMIARIATPEEKAEMWPEITSKYKGYAGYQEKTTRDIPLAICTPA